MGISIRKTRAFIVVNINIDDTLFRSTDKKDIELMIEKLLDVVEELSDYTDKSMSDLVVNYITD